MNRFTRIGLLIPLLLILAATASMATIYVDADSTYDGPGNDWDHAYHTIQAAIDAAGAWSYIEVAGPHTYAEGITCNKLVTITGSKGGMTTIDPPGGTTAVTLTATCTLADFRITGAYTGLSITGGTPTVRGCMIDTCIIRAVYASVDATIERCIVAGNSPGTQGGAGIMIISAAPTIRSCLITGNAATTGAGIAISGGGQAKHPHIYNCTITGNTASSNGGAIWVSNCAPYIYNCIIAGNTASSGSAFYMRTEGGCDVAYSTFHGNSSPQFDLTGWDVIGYDGNTDDDPQFLGASDYRLDADSACVGTGSNSYASGYDLIGFYRTLPYGGTVDRGCYEGASVLTDVHSGNYVEIRDWPVTLNNSTAFYIEDPTRAKGIRVAASSSASAGDTAIVYGALTVGQDGEREITPLKLLGVPQCWTVTGSSSNVPAPLLMNNTAVLSNMAVGLRVKTIGKVTATAFGCFMMSDRSPEEVYVIWPGTMPDEDDYVSVVGINTKAVLMATEVAVRATDVSWPVLTPPEGPENPPDPPGPPTEEEMQAMREACYARWIARQQLQ